MGEYYDDSHIDKVDSHSTTMVRDLLSSCDIDYDAVNDDDDD